MIIYEITQTFGYVILKRELLAEICVKCLEHFPLKTNQNQITFEKKGK